VKGTCKSCGQRVRIEADDESTGRVINCPQCGVPVKVGADKSYHPSTLPLTFAGVLLAIAVGITIYYAIREATATDLQGYNPNSAETIAYAIALVFSFSGLMSSLFGVLTNIVERHRYMLTLVLNLAMLVFWAAWFWQSDVI
jgi:uncharacterized protein with PQ loop repeat